MKKLFLSLLTISLLLFNSCSNNESIDETNYPVSTHLKNNDQVVFRKYEDLLSFTHFHQIAVDETLESFEDEFLVNPDKYVIDNKIDKLAVVNFFLDKSVAFIENNPLPYKDELRSLDFLSDLTDEQKLELFYQVVRATGNKNMPSENINKYYKKISVAVFANAEDKGAFHDFLKNLYDETFVDSDLTSADINSIHIMIGIGYDSFNNWYDTSHGLVTTSASGRKKHKASGTTVLADICGGVTGALWGGAVAGPLGAVVLGINGAIIDSGTEMALSKVLGRFTFEW